MQKIEIIQRFSMKLIEFISCMVSSVSSGAFRVKFSISIFGLWRKPPDQPFISALHAENTKQTLPARYEYIHVNGVAYM